MPSPSPPPPTAPAPLGTQETHHGKGNNREGNMPGLGLQATTREACSFWLPNTPQSATTKEETWPKHTSPIRKLTGPGPAHTMTPKTSRTACQLVIHHWPFTKDLGFIDDPAKVQTWSTLRQEPLQCWCTGWCLHACQQGDAGPHSQLYPSPEGGNMLDLSFDEETVERSHSSYSDFPRNA